VLAVSNLETDFDKMINVEFERRKKLDKHYEMREEASIFGLTAEDEEREKLAQKKFKIALTTIKVTLMLNADGYRVCFKICMQFPAINTFTFFRIK